MTKKMLKRDFVGRRARLTKQLRNVGGDILDAGEVVTITGTHQGRFSIEIVTECAHCYRRRKVSMNQVSESYFRLIDEKAQVTMFDKPKLPEVAIITGGDWVGLYIDGELKAENHSLEYPDVLDSLGIKYTWREVQMDPYEFSSLPKKFDDIPAERFR